MALRSRHDVGLLREYAERTQVSHRLHERFRRSLPAGETRTLTYYEPYPVVLEHGEGPSVMDVDGNRYLDVLNNYTSLVHGHAFPPAVEAIAAAASLGTAFPASHPKQLEWAELLTSRYPAVELVRFTNSGSEAAILAARIARRVTGRRRLVLFGGAYHGTGAEFLGEGDDVVAVPYGDLDRAAGALDATVAAVFVEPFLGSSGVVEAVPEFLHGLREETRRSGTLLVLDEVQSLRNALHGVHGALELAPDLVLMGKIVGGGLPVGAVGGSRDVLAVTAADRTGRLPHSGTFNGNPVTAAAGIAYLAALEEQTIETLNARAEELAQGIGTEASEAGIALDVRRSGSIMHVDLGDEEAQRLLHLALLLEGVFAAPRGMLNLSTVMTGADCAAISRAYGRALDRLRDAR